MQNKLTDFKRRFLETYRSNQIGDDEAYQLSMLISLIKECAPSFSRTDMYTALYDMYIEEQTPILNQCVDLVSGWDEIDGLEFLSE